MAVGRVTLLSLLNIATSIKRLIGAYQPLSLRCRASHRSSASPAGTAFILSRVQISDIDVTVTVAWPFHKACVCKPSFNAPGGATSSAVPRDQE
jgi:hypothetical protein